MSTTDTTLILPTDPSRKPYCIHSATDDDGVHQVFDCHTNPAENIRGFMYCALCGFTDPPNEQPVWCDHLARAMVEGVDGRHLNPELDPRTCQLPFAVMVPMKPTRKSYALVYVETPEPDGGREAMWCTYPNGGLEYVPLGHMYPGEGRLSLRSTIYDILRGEWPQRTQWCVNPAHDGFKYNSTWSPKRGVDPDENELISLMHIMQVGKCLPCMERSWELSPDDAFVPDI